MISDIRNLINHCQEDSLWADLILDFAPQSKERGMGRTPLSTRIYEKLVADVAREQIYGLNRNDRMALVAMFHTDNVRQDTDNMIKSVSDGLQGIAFNNDNQIDLVIGGRRVVEKGEQPYTEIQLFTLG